MKIQQAYIGVKHFKPAFLEKYDLTDYQSADEPCVFFGCYMKQWYGKFMKHNALGVMVWAGTDILQLMSSENAQRDIKAKKNIHHVAISDFIARDLECLGIPFTRLPIIPFNAHSSLIALPLGRKIYVYTNSKRPDFYGMPIIERLMKDFPTITFDIVGSKDNPRDTVINKIYPDCFMGIRPVEHDGLSNTVVELGLMGRKVVWNGDTPNAIPWNSYMDIKEAIVQERKKVGQINHLLSGQMENYLKLPEDWLTEKYWNKLKVLSK